VKRRAVLPITLTCLLLSVIGHAQRVSIAQDNAPVEDVFATIEKQTAYKFLYDISLLAHARKVNLHINNFSLQETLDALCWDQPFNWKIVNKNIILQAKAVSAEVPRGPTWITVHGKVTNETSEPLGGVSIIAKNSSRFTTTSENGDFVLDNVLDNDSLIISSINYEREGIKVQGTQPLPIQLKAIVSQLREVIVSNGYQKTTTERSTGSYVKISNELLNRRVSTTILERLEGVTNGLIFNKNVQIGADNKMSSISIRGRSTIYANPEPLIILDNFPYTGDPANINPNDVESITVLKDAAAASIWGAYAANGVVVIITKTGKYKQPLQVSFNSNVTIGAKPDLYYKPTVSSSDMIEVEKFLFGLHFYDSREANRLPIPPAVEILIGERNGKLTSTEAQAQLDVLRGLDVRRDEDKYVYRNSINQQHSVNLSGGSANNQYYFSAGYDKNLNSMVGNQYNRITLNANNTYAWLNKKLELSTGILFSASTTQNNNYGQANTNFPYQQLVDNDGSASALTRDHRVGYIDTAGGGRLLDWKYRPLDEINQADNKTFLTDYRINVGLKYQVYKDLFVNVLYQYNRGAADQENLKSQQTYYTRDLINQFTQFNGTAVIRPIPLGDILDKTGLTHEAQNFRGQLNFQHAWNEKNALSAIAGAEVRRFDKQTDINRLYGYNEERQIQMPVDYSTNFPLYQEPTKLQKIPYEDKSSRSTDRFVSYYLNTAYTFYKRYILTASARKDRSNIFGVKTNQKGVPLWSAGVAWEVSKEGFYHYQNWLPYLKLRITNGYNGNVDRTVAAFTSASLDGYNPWQAPLASIVNPPNPALRWEKVHMVNFAVDFSTLHNIISGSLEYYIRKATDLIGNSPLDPTTGVSAYRGNTSDMEGHGFDITITTQNMNKQVKWSSILLFSHAVDKVTEFKSQQTAVGAYMNTLALTPVKGKPLYSVYSFKWHGLDPMTGDPIGQLNGTNTKEYGLVVNSYNVDELRFHGSQVPTFFGSLRNNLAWKELELSFNITWKAGYYFKAPSISYYGLFNEFSNGSPDFSKRWIKPGDESHTNVPSMIFINDSNRDLFYNNSEIQVENGDHIRLQDIRLAYDVGKRTLGRLPIQRLKFYAYANNIGILWRSNNRGIDPDYVSTIPIPRSIAIGMNIELK
jgi:TonB-linked SusC/RagA family outer membrane protein